MSSSKVWFLDSGASLHLTSDINLLHDFQLLKEPEQLVGVNGNVVRIRGRGLVKTKQLKILDVHYADGLKPGYNLISISKLVNDCSLFLQFTRMQCFIRDSKTRQEVGRFSLNKGRYRLEYLYIEQDVGRGLLAKESQEKSKATVSQEPPQVETARPYSYESPHLMVPVGTKHYMMTRDQKTTRENTESQEWVLDSGAWIHHTSNPRLLLDGGDLHETADDLKRGDDVLHILGHGSVRTDGFEVPSVCYVKGDVRNVISVQQLSRDHALVTVFESTHCFVRYRANGQIAGWGRLRNGVYVLDSLLISQDIGGGGGNEGGRREEGSGGGGSGTTGHEGGGGGGAAGGHGGDGRDSEGSRGGGAAGGHGGDGRDSGGKDSRGGGDKQINDSDDYLQAEEDQDDDNEVEDNTNELQKVDMFGVLQFICRIIATALDYIIPSRFRRGSEVRVTEENGRRDLKEPSEAHARLFGLSREMPRDRSGNLHCKLSTSAFPSSSSEARCKEFLVDSGASFHTTWNETDLTPYLDSSEPPIESFVGIGPGCVKVTRSGYLKTDNIVLDGILLAPMAQANLVSVGQLTNQYYVAVEMDHKEIIITNKSSRLKIGGGKMKQYGHHFVLEYFQPGELRADLLRRRRPNTFGKSIFSRPPRR